MLCSSGLCLQERIVIDGVAYWVESLYIILPEPNWNFSDSKMLTRIYADSSRSIL